MKQDLYDLLLRSLDQELSTKETNLLEKALAKSPELRKEKEQLLATRNLFANWTVAKDPSFSSAVMNRIGEIKQKLPNSFSPSVIRLFPSVAAACIIFIMIMLLNIYLTDGSLSSEAMLGLENLYPEEAEFTDLDF